VGTRPCDETHFERNGGPRPHRRPQIFQRRSGPRPSKAVLAQRLGTAKGASSRANKLKINDPITNPSKVKAGACGCENGWSKHPRAFAPGMGGRRTQHVEKHHVRRQTSGSGREKGSAGQIVLPTSRQAKAGSHPGQAAFARGEQQHGGWTEGAGRARVRSSRLTRVIFSRRAGGAKRREHASLIKIRGRGFHRPVSGWDGRR